MTHRHRQKPGVVLLLALLLLAAVTASTIGTALTISSTTSQSTNLDNFILASLASDSGIERSLLIVKYFRQNGTIAEAITTVNVASGTAVNVGPTTRGQFLGTARPASDPVLIPRLRPGESTLFDVLEYDSGTGALLDSTAKNIYIKGSAPASLGATTCGSLASWTANLEVSWILLDQYGDSSCTGRYYADTSALACGVSPVLLASITNQQGEACTELNPKGFRVRLRALDLDLPSTKNDVTDEQETIVNLTAEAYPCDVVTTANCGSPSGVPGRIQIDMTGQAGSSKALKTASVLWQLPASGLFNYVLFTEGDIVPN